MSTELADAVHHVVKKVIERLKKPIEIHCHQDFGLGVANTISALTAGASVAQTTITGLGERAGNTALEEIEDRIHSYAHDADDNERRENQRHVEI